MKVKFPAMQATIGQRTYYACVMKLTAIPKMFTFRDWIEFTPEDREQRVLNKNRIPDIAGYILDNEDGYLFSSITASYQCPVRFVPVNADGLGFLEMDFEEADFVINDGQHRCAAIAQAIKENPALGEESISVLLFPYESKERVQQMFADLNRYVVKTNMATNIIIDHRDMLGRVIKEVCETVPAFQGLVDKEHQSLPARSEKAFTLYSLYDATKELVAGQTTSGQGGFDGLVRVAADYWTTVSNFMPDWLKVKNREIRPIELRQENISTHSVVLRALGGVGAELIERHPLDWKDHLSGLKTINWSKRNRDWENVCMVANSVVANRQARLATKAYLKRKLNLPVSDSEQRSIEHLTTCDFSPSSKEVWPAEVSSTFRDAPVALQQVLCVAAYVYRGGSVPNNCRAEFLDALPFTAKKFGVGETSVRDKCTTDRRLGVPGVHVTAEQFFQWLSVPAALRSHLFQRFPEWRTQIANFFVATLPSLPLQ